jgi:hypothetical protein
MMHILPPEAVTMQLKGGPLQGEMLFLQ